KFPFSRCHIRGDVRMAIRPDFVGDFRHKYLEGVGFKISENSGSNIVVVDADKCGNFTFSVMIGVPDGSTTVGSDNHLVLRPISDSDAAVGSRFCCCTQVPPDGTDNKNDNQFHLALLSSEASHGQILPHGMEMFGGHVFVSANG